MINNKKSSSSSLIILFMYQSLLNTIPAIYCYIINIPKTYKLKTTIFKNYFSEF